MLELLKERFDPQGMVHTLYEGGVEFGEFLFSFGHRWDGAIARIDPLSFRDENPGLIVDTAKLVVDDWKAPDRVAFRFAGRTTLNWVPTKSESRWFSHSPRRLEILRPAIKKPEVLIEHELSDALHRPSQIFPSPNGKWVAVGWIGDKARKGGENKGFAGVKRHLVLFDSSGKEVKRLSDE